MGRRFRTLALILAAALLLLVPPIYLLKTDRRHPAADPLHVITKYLRVLYARDFNQAYRFISTQDRQLKTAPVYVRERGPFTGFASEVAHKLADLIQVKPVQEWMDGNRLRLKLTMRLPDANAVAPLLFNWDEERLNGLASTERRKILAALDNQTRNGKLKMIQGEEEFTLVKEASGWKVFLDWAGGMRVNFSTKVPDFASFEAHPVIKETVTRPNELFTISYKVKNRSRNDLFARIVHHVEPRALAHHLDIVECALLLPVRLLPGEEQEYASTYLVRGDLPDGTKELTVVYEFKVDD